MAYQALYRKYRPQTFAQVYGQGAIKRTLENALQTQKIAHAYLFCGPRGTGKTSMARLLAKALNCQQGIGQQCGKCNSCQAIAAGNHPDVIEIDAASNSRVEDVRDLISQVSYQPIMGRYRVYIIDEVHNMSGSAFNALLKTLEEPPANVVFILATTEPQKILPTILSRVQRFDFSKVSVPDLMANMAAILQKEQVTYEEKALEKLAQLADGGVRDALSLLDQAVSFGGQQVTAQDVESLFGLADVDNLGELALLAHRGQITLLLQKAREYYARGMDVVRASKDLAKIYKDILIRQMGGRQELLEELTIAKVDSLKEISTSECEKNIALLVQAQRDYRYAHDIMDAFELCLIQMGQHTDKVPVVEEITQIKTAVVAKPKVAVVVKEKTEKKVEEKPQSGVALEEQKIAEIAADQIINLMVQGDKNLKTTLVDGWEGMNSTDNKALNLLRSGTPAIANKQGLIIATVNESQARQINSAGIRDKIRGVIMANFHISPQVGAITNDRFTELVGEYKHKVQADTLPAPRPIDLFTETAEKHQESGLTNAAKFLADLQSGGN